MKVMCSSKTPSSLRSSVGLVRLLLIMAMPIQICTGANETHRLDQLKQMIYGKRVDGLIFLYSKLNDPLVDFCIQDKFPFLILGKATSPFVSLVD